MKQELKETIQADIFRNLGCELSTGQIIKKFLFEESRPWKFIVMFRLAHEYDAKKGIIGKIIKKLYNYFAFKYGYEIAPRTQIGKGFRLPHRGGIIVIHANAVIGEQCEIMQGVTIGNNIMKSRNAVAVIGNGVTLCAGAKVIGDVRIGDNVMIGANSVVTKDIPANSIAAGMTARVIKANVTPPIVYDLKNISK
ncbi:serine acetyltransferase [Bacillus sp. ISL-40]|uniref:serine acetyltransferase n=1 Tax=unclassified Bacillus (in: firmicutes) TaxID=185979 RepID=UPI001BE7AFC8|nr:MULTISPECIES: DapH/DapD/GlmU-related protein [unclassified Bacillus (in: firmicutes)]MBT2701026.1 serine acetyltransferase [Bacillus sp. ISL-40]MBT2739318.1 serine acetyltransferase [Bacillus sp. ISL-77]